MYGIHNGSDVSTFNHVFIIIEACFEFERNYEEEIFEVCMAAGAVHSG